MYLKSIEVHGFKSFANKIVFEFHDGITAIVGPNGSGKSNVADAVRWVLGEQSAKQLRGSSMQDVIFSGSEARKPLGYAYVSITFDNSGHSLPIAYDEVSVARRVYRSGESEYLINGSNCRLRDVQELFMDTGIGKEGYSIIGQGQIDRILSTKPEDRRELFDEAAGIVKFKKRRALAEKNLEEERLNLSRVNDILAEIDNQLGPLEKQSEVAKEYLLMRDRLRALEVNQFLLEYERSGALKKSIDEKYAIAEEDYTRSKEAYDNAKQEYEALESELERYGETLNSGRNEKNEVQLSVGRLEGEIKVLREQLASIAQNDAHYGERMQAVGADIEKRREELLQYNEKKQECARAETALRERMAASAERLSDIQEKLAQIERESEEHNASIIRLLGDSGAVRTNLQRYETMLEQNNIKKAQLSRQIIANRSEEAEAGELSARQEESHNEVLKALEECRQATQAADSQIKDFGTRLEALRREHDARQREYMSEQSRLESMRNIAERYDGYNSSIRRVMEKKSQYPGIAGVVADIITVDKRYETAVETALGASIQNIVVDSEATAKQLIEYLKKNKYGRATFLPLTSVGAGRQEARGLRGGKGVIGAASELVGTDERYAGIVSHLLGRIIVVDNIDNAIALEKQNGYSLRLVTLEGELLSPGGALSGGAYRNSSGLLGRRREIEEIEERCASQKERLARVKADIGELDGRRQELKKSLEASRQQLQELLVRENEEAASLRSTGERLASINKAYEMLRRELGETDSQNARLKKDIESQKEKLRENSDTNCSLEQAIADCARAAGQLKAEERGASEETSALRAELAGLGQNAGFIGDNISRIENEIASLKAEQKTISENAASSQSERRARETEIIRLENARTQAEASIAQLEGQIAATSEKMESVSREHKGFLERWQELGSRVNALDKEMFRLQGQREKLAEQIDSQISYIWEEYELTVSTAAQLRDENIRSAASNKKDIGELKNSIKALGSVNVNAIEDFKNLSERKSFLTAQRDDLISSGQKITDIIQELDVEMRRQFTERFELIRGQFNQVFRELFGGGKAELELTEDEDVLEAGIIIIAQPPGKKLQNMMQLSGGERSLTAISLLFAIQNLKPSPFCLLDEIEAALDDSNVRRFASYLKKLTKSSQFIVITHRRGTMAAADILYGITMQEKGVSTLVSVSLIEDDLDT